MGVFASFGTLKYVTKIDENKIALKDVCPEGAIFVSDKTTYQDLTADAIIVATGFVPFNAERKATYELE